jgi:proteasome lid subunit RPN8/RPN11
MLNIKMDKIKINVPKKIKNKMEYLCQEIPDKEWAGLLLYTVDGSIRKPQKMQVFIQDIIPMQVGNATSADFTLNQDGKDKHIDYVINNPKSLHWKLGLIHSHNRMATYFSGTDISELEYNAKNHDFYLSVITNNAGDVIGKIAIQCEGEITTTFKATDQNGKEYTLKKEEAKKPIGTMVIYDCDINLLSNKDIPVSEQFIKEVETLIEESHHYEIIQREDEHPALFNLKPYQHFPSYLQDKTPLYTRGTTQTFDSLNHLEEEPYSELDLFDMIEYNNLLTNYFKFKMEEFIDLENDTRDVYESSVFHLWDLIKFLILQMSFCFKIDPKTRFEFIANMEKKIKDIFQKELRSHKLEEYPENIRIEQYDKYQI